MNKFIKANETTVVQDVPLKEFGRAKTEASGGELKEAKAQPNWPSPAP